MAPDLQTRRRALVILYRRHLRAERAWRLAQREALSWFPLGTRPSVRPIGNPGSHVRRLYEKRNRTLAQLMLAHRHLSELRHRHRAYTKMLVLPHRAPSNPEDPARPTL